MIFEKLFSVLAICSAILFPSSLLGFDQSEKSDRSEVTAEISKLLSCIQDDEADALMYISKIPLEKSGLLNAYSGKFMNARFLIEIPYMTASIQAKKVTRHKNAEGKSTGTSAQSPFMINYFKDGGAKKVLDEIFIPQYNQMLAASPGLFEIGKLKDLDGIKGFTIDIKQFDNQTLFMGYTNENIFVYSSIPKDMKDNDAELQKFIKNKLVPSKNPSKLISLLDLSPETVSSEILQYPPNSFISLRVYMINDDTLFDNAEYFITTHKIESDGLVCIQKIIFKDEKDAEKAFDTLSNEFENNNFAKNNNDFGKVTGVRDGKILTFSAPFKMESLVVKGAILADYRKTYDNIQTLDKALKIYHSEKGSLPDTLDDLVMAEYVKADTLRAPITNSRFLYFGKDLPKDAYEKQLNLPIIVAVSIRKNPVDNSCSIAIVYNTPVTTRGSNATLSPSNSDHFKSSYMNQLNSAFSTVNGNETLSVDEKNYIDTVIIPAVIKDLEARGDIEK